MTQGRAACRSGRRCEPRSLQEAIYCVVHHSRLTVAEIAERLGVRQGYLLDAANPDREDTQFQTRWLVPLTTATGNTALVQYLARSVGGAFFQLPTLTSGSHEDVAAEAVRAMAEIGDVFAEMRQALEDNRITQEEAARFAREVDEAIAGLAALRELFHAKAKQEGRPAPALRAAK